MTTKLVNVFACVIAAYSLSFVAVAHEKKQVQLDKACEEARQIALQPRKKEIYQECRNKFKKSKSVCQAEAKVYNGNRINGAPMFYELPACEKAFDFRKKHTN